MFALILKRFGASIFTLLGISLLAFSLIRLVPGDPVMLLLGERGASPEVYAELNRSLGLDQPAWKQYGIFLWKAVHGDLGVSIFSKQPVLNEFLDRFPATLELSFFAILLAILIGVPAGIVSALKRNSVVDYGVMGVSLVGYSMPIFWWALLLTLFFSVNLGWTPVSGRMNVIFEVEPVTGFMLIDTWFSEQPWEAFVQAVRHLLLPAIALGTIPLAVISRMTRSSMLEVLGEDYMRTARSKGLSRVRIVLVHGLRNALIPIITVVGLMVGTLLTGAILTETIFSWPGIGRWMISAVMARDYSVIQGGVLLIALIIILVNVTVDILYAVIDPRLRKRG